MSSKQTIVASFVASVRAIYLVLIDNSIIVVCFLEHQLTVPLLSMKMKPEVDFWLFLLPAQSEFEYPSINSFF